MSERKRWEQPGDPCPWCGGGGEVLSIPLDRVIVCRLCGGRGTWDGIVPDTMHLGSIEGGGDDIPPDLRGKSLTEVVEIAAACTHLVGRPWIGAYGDRGVERVGQIIEEGLEAIARGAPEFGTGGIVLRRDTEDGNVSVSVVIGTRWDDTSEGPEWT